METLAVREHAPRFAAVPNEPGVYVFRDEQGAVLYVGKSKTLRRRLQTHFAKRTPERRKRTMLQLFAATVAYERTGSHFAALLREVELVQQLRPRFNRRLRYPERYAYIALDLRSRFPRLVLTTEPWPLGRFLGPFTARSRMRQALEELCDAFGLRTCDDPLPAPSEGLRCWRYRVRTCLAPCQGMVSAGQYGRALLLAVQTLSGSRVALRKWEQQREALSEALAFERAERLLARELRVRAAQRLLAISVRRGDHAVVVQPAVSPKYVSLWAVCDGDVAASYTVAHAQVKEAFEALWPVFQRPGPKVRFVEQAALDRRWLIFQWLRTEEGKTWSVRVQPGQAAKLVWPDIQARLQLLPRVLFTEPL
jgi:excinuclease UvrABC nuclease subunit